MRLENRSLSLQFPFWRHVAIVAAALIFSLPDAQAQANELDECAMLDAVNAERTSRGLSAITWNNDLEEAALGHSRDMAANNFMSHTGSNGSSMTDRINATGYGWSRISENVARGYTTVTSVMGGWMGSDGHRANILDPNITEMGAAMVGNFWTQNFGSPSSGTPSDDRPNCRPAGGGGGGGGGGSGSNNLVDLAGYSRGLADYYYNYFGFSGDWNLGLAYYYFYAGQADYYTFLGQSQSPEAWLSYYNGMALYAYYAFASAGDFESATNAYYYYLAYAYYAYYLAYGDYATAVSVFNEVYSYAFG